MVVVALVVLFTLGNATANLIPVHRPTAAELRADEQAALVAQRKARLAALAATPDRCQPAVAHERAKLLAMDGQFAGARRYADDYEARCGGDPVVRHWGDAPAPKHQR